MVKNVRRRRKKRLKVRSGKWVKTSVMKGIALSMVLLFVWPIFSEAFGGLFIGKALSNEVAYAEGEELCSGDVFEKLQNLSVRIYQEDVEVGNAEGNPIDMGKPFRIEVDFDVPVLGDYDLDQYGQPIEENAMYVSQGDVACFILGNAFRIDAPIEGTPFQFGDFTIGHLLVENTPQGVVAMVVFDGDANVFNGTVNGVEISFSMELSYVSSEELEEGEEVILTILGKEFTFLNPVVPVETSFEKSGVRDGQFIDWVIEVNAIKGGQAFDLSGYKFLDDLNLVGAFVENSFKVGTTSNKEDAVAVVEGFFYEDGVISYVFPEGSVGKQFLHFRTEIPEEKFFGVGTQEVKNLGRLRKGEETWEDDYTITFMVQWIEKAAGNITYTVGPPAKASIEWVITANTLSAALKNAVITDVLDDGLRFVSASWTKNVDGQWVDKQDITPNEAQEYFLGDIDTPIQLTILTEVKKDVEIGHEIQRFRNNASIRWDGLTGTIGSGTVNVDIGTNPIKKTGGAYNPQDATIPWTVEVKKSNVNVQLRVMDLLVHHASAFDMQGTYTIQGMDGNHALLQVSSEDFQKLRPRFNQMFTSGSFQGDGLDHRVYPVIDQEGKKVADLLVVTDIEADGLQVTSDPVTFSFNTTVTNPGIFAAAGGATNVPNTAVLFSANKKLNESTATVSARSNMLRKELLRREDQEDPNGRTSDEDLGFNYVDRSVVFRILVNHNNIQGLENMKNGQLEGLGVIKLTDTLPSGWIFEAFSDGDAFKIFEGNPQSGGNIEAGNPVSMGANFANDFIGENKVEFTFDTLDRPYVILVRARPTEEEAERYFDGNKNTRVTNTAVLEGQNGLRVTASRNVRIVSTLFTKERDIAPAGLLKWRIEYRPDMINGKGTLIEDTLPQGIELPMDAQGNILVENNIVITKLALKPDGTYEDLENVEVQLGEGGNVQYDAAERKLTFVIEDANQAYRYSYLTEVVGDVGTTLVNEAKLIGLQDFGAGTSSTYTISRQDLSATLSKNGFMEIQKTNNQGQPLEGVQFTLYTETGERVLRTVRTNAAGEISLRGLRPGVYFLKETEAKEGYVLSDRIYRVEVRGSGAEAVVTVDGEAFQDNVLKVVNFREEETGVTGLVIEKEASKETYETVGETITYTLRVENTGVLTLRNVQVRDERLNKSWIIDVLLPNAVWTTQVEYVITQEDLDKGTVVNLAKVQAENPLEGPDLEDEDEEIIQAEQDPRLTLEKTADKDTFVVGEEITYTFTVRNTGNVTLTNVTVTDPLIGLSQIVYKTVDGITVEAGESITLAPGQVLVAKATYRVTQADMDHGSIYNKATVTGTPPKGEDVEDEDDVTRPGMQEPGISLEKTADKDTLMVGEEITYTFRVRNTGNVTLTNVTVTDPLMGLSQIVYKTVDGIAVEAGESITLAPGQVLVAEATYKVTQEDMDHGSVVNKATVTGTPPKGEDVDDEDEETIMGVQEPGISLEKTADKDTLMVGEEITYTFRVRNIGNVTLTNVTVTDPLIGLSKIVYKTVDGIAVEAGESITLAPGQVLVAEATYKVTQGDMDHGSVVNKATVTGTPPKGEDVDDEDEETIMGVQEPGISLEKTADKDTLMVGEEITYTFRVRNIGNVTLTNVTVTDPLIGLSKIVYKTVDGIAVEAGESITLAPGQVLVAEATYKVTQGDMDHGSVYNKATVTGTPPKGEDVDDEDDLLVSGDQKPGISIEKQADKDQLTVGETVTYRFTVRNTGNVTLHDVRIEDPLDGLSEILYESINGRNLEEYGPIILAPGDELIASATYKVQQKDVDQEGLINTAKVIGRSPKEEEVQDADDELIDGNPLPSMTIEKRADKEVFSELGEVIRYTFIVRNTGNMTLKDVQVTDTLEGLSTIVYVSINGNVIAHQESVTLAPGDVLVAEATYKITQRDLNRGKRGNLAKASGETVMGDPVEDEDEVEIIGERNPSFEVIKTSPQQIFRAVGDQITYSVKAINTGNVTLHNVEIKDEMEGLMNVRFMVYDWDGNLLAKDAKNGEVSLGAGQYLEMTATYTIKEADIERGTLENRALGKAVPESEDGEDIPGDEEFEFEDISNHSFVRTLQIVKVDQETKKPLAGAVFEVEDEFGQKFVLTTDKDGKAVLEDLFLGTYFVKEIEAPEGYVLEPKVHEMTLGRGEDVLEMVITNKAIPTERLPDTGERSQSIAFMLLGLLMIGLGAFSLHSKRKAV